MADDDLFTYDDGTNRRLDTLTLSFMNLKVTLMKRLSRGDIRYKQAWEEVDADLTYFEKRCAQMRQQLMALAPSEE